MNQKGDEESSGTDSVDKLKSCEPSLRGRNGIFHLTHLLSLLSWEQV